jgi:DNA-binding XRE family transcriptional regulator
VAGPILPRKATALARSREALRSVAFQVGTIVSVERNRRKMTQRQVAEVAKVSQITVSSIENGQRIPKTITDQKIERVFAAVGLSKKGIHANFVKWWRDNGR